MKIFFKSWVNSACWTQNKKYSYSYLTFCVCWGDNFHWGRLTITGYSLVWRLNEPMSIKNFKS